jgi:hypothetical protein
MPADNAVGQGGSLKAPEPEALPEGEFANVANGAARHSFLPQAPRIAGADGQTRKRKTASKTDSDQKRRMAKESGVPVDAKTKPQAGMVYTALVSEVLPGKENERKTKARKGESNGLGGSMQDGMGDKAMAGTETPTPSNVGAQGAKAARSGQDQKLMERIGPSGPPSPSSIRGQRKSLLKDPEEHKATATLALAAAEVARTGAEAIVSWRLDGGSDAAHQANGKMPPLPSPQIRFPSLKAREELNLGKGTVSGVADGAVKRKARVAKPEKAGKGGKAKRKRGGGFSGTPRVNGDGVGVIVPVNILQEESPDQAERKLEPPIAAALNGGPANGSKQRVDIGTADPAEKGMDGNADKGGEQAPEEEFARVANELLSLNGDSANGMHRSSFHTGFETAEEGFLGSMEEDQQSVELVGPAGSPVRKSGRARRLSKKADELIENSPQDAKGIVRVGQKEGTSRSRHREEADVAGAVAHRHGEEKLVEEEPTFAERPPLEPQQQKGKRVLFGDMGELAGEGGQKWNEGPAANGLIVGGDSAGNAGGAREAGGAASAAGKEPPGGVCSEPEWAKEKKGGGKKQRERAGGQAGSLEAEEGLDTGGRREREKVESGSAEGVREKGAAKEKRREESRAQLAQTEALVTTVQVDSRPERSKQGGDLNPMGLAGAASSLILPPDVAILKGESLLEEGEGEEREQKMKPLAEVLNKKDSKRKQTAAGKAAKRAKVDSPAGVLTPSKPTRGLVMKTCVNCGKTGTSEKNNFYGHLSTREPLCGSCFQRANGAKRKAVREKRDPLKAFEAALRRGTKAVLRRKPKVARAPLKGKPKTEVAPHKEKPKVAGALPKGNPKTEAAPHKEKPKAESALADGKPKVEAALVPRKPQREDLSSSPVPPFKKAPRSPRKGVKPSESARLTWRSGYDRAGSDEVRLSNGSGSLEYLGTRPAPGGSNKAIALDRKVDKDGASAHAESLGKRPVAGTSLESGLKRRGGQVTKGKKGGDAGAGLKRKKEATEGSPPEKRIKMDTAALTKMPLKSLSNVKQACAARKSLGGKPPLSPGSKKKDKIVLSSPVEGPSASLQKPRAPLKKPSKGDANKPPEKGNRSSNLQTPPASPAYSHRPESPLSTPAREAHVNGASSPMPSKLRKDSQGLGGSDADNDAVGTSGRRKGASGAPDLVGALAAFQERKRAEGVFYE